MTTLRFAAAALLLSMSASAFAQKPPPIQVRSPQGPQPITRNALAGNIETRFATIDTNHNGSLDAAEIGAELQRELDNARNLIAQQMRAKFKQIDTNRDGQLSLAEFMAAGPTVRQSKTPQQQLEELDTNHDGKVSVEEFKAPDMAKFNRADTNHDGIVTPAEAQAAASRK